MVTNAGWILEPPNTGAELPKENDLKREESSDASRCSVLLHGVPASSLPLLLLVVRAGVSAFSTFKAMLPSMFAKLFARGGGRVANGFFGTTLGD